MIRAARDRGFGVIVGAQVGETASWRALRSSSREQPEERSSASKARTGSASSSATRPPFHWDLALAVASRRRRSTASARA
jgi:hypothetical protein